MDNRPAFTSIAIHGIAAVLLFSVAVTRTAPRRSMARDVKLLAPRPTKRAGGGGEQAHTPASRGTLPPVLPHQFTPPRVQLVNFNPKLPMAPSLELPPDVPIPIADHFGDPLSKLVGLSGGTGGPLGIGDGHGSGIGANSGPGFHDGDVEGRIFLPGRGVSMPVLIRRVEPEFTEQARKSKTQGTVVIRAVVDSTGKPRDIRVVRGIGLGLDERAIEAVAQWLFKPGTKDGKPVAVSANIEVSFHLL